MKNIRKNVIVKLVLVAWIVFFFWINGTIPKQIAKISSVLYLKKNFPKMQVKNLTVEWSPEFGDYIIGFEDEGNDEGYGYCIGPKYFPICPGQGEFGLREEYREKYENTQK